MKRIGQYIHILIAVLLLTACGKKFNLPGDDTWYKARYKGTDYYFMTHNDTAAIYSPSKADTDGIAAPDSMTYQIRGKRIVITHLGHGQKNTGKINVRTGKISFEPYVEPVFVESDYRFMREPYLETKDSADLVYGHARGYWTSMPGVESDITRIFTQGVLNSFSQRNLELTLDLCRPVDTREKHPLILFIHGGAFYFGDKKDPVFVDLCHHFASMGYVTASMNYRMGFHIGKADIERAGYAAAQDAHAAMRWLVSKADELGIDTDWLFVAGSSSGSITSLNMVFMNDAQRPESTRGHKKLIGADLEDMGPIDHADNDLTDKFKIRAIANMWGAVSTLDMLENSKTSIISFHGDADQIVPLGKGYPFSIAGNFIASGLADVMYGSESIHDKARELGLRSEFHPYPGEGHAFNTSREDKQPNSNHYAIRSDMTRFFYEERVPQQAVVENLGGGHFSVSGPVDGNISWKVQGGLIVSHKGSEAQILWLKGQEHSLQASGQYESGPGFLTSTQLP